MVVAVKLGEPVDIFPDYGVGGMEDMGAVDMVFNAGLRVPGRVTVAADMVTTINDRNLPA